jgi:hypothetical protein
MGWVWEEEIGGGRSRNWVRELVSLGVRLVYMDTEWIGRYGS